MNIECEGTLSPAISAADPGATSMSKILLPRILPTDRAPY
jgi:hypothetical protein